MWVVTSAGVTSIAELQLAASVFVVHLPVTMLLLVSYKHCLLQIGKYWSGYPP